MLHLGIGNKHNRTPVILMQHGINITVITHTGQVLGEYEINTEKNYQKKKIK